MTINQTCVCGVKLQAKDELAGKQVKCPKCGDTLWLPSKEVAPPHIRVNCSCGKAFQVKASSAGRAFQCSGCNRSLTVPNSNERSPAKPNSEFFGTNDPASISGSLFDQNFLDVQFPAATYIPPSTPALQQPSQSRSKPKSKKGSPNDDQDASGPKGGSVHIDYIAYCLYATSALGVLFFLGMLVVFLKLPDPDAAKGLTFLKTIFMVVALVGMLFFGAYAAVGYGLQQRAGWARIVALIMGVLYLPSVPVGTAIGVYLFMVLTDKENAKAFK